MLYPTTITQKWQMTIPKPVREILGINKQQRVFLEVDKKKKTLKIKKPSDFLSLAGTFKPKKKIDILKTRELFEKHYERI